MIRISSKGDFNKTTEFLKKMKRHEVKSILNKYGQRGVELLEEATPKRSGKTASSWRYEISYTDGKYEIIWLNDNINKNVNIAILIQYGHGTGWGGYVQGIDYINPATQKVFEEMADEVWREVTQS